ncbi:MAG TPA: S41 family peptidase [Gemmatimonadales bacterium]|nr:S41 family peptidase [Gemmatimonadales bacterium]
MTRKRILVVAGLAAVALASGGWLLQRGEPAAGSVYQQARLFDEVLAHVADYYVDSLDERQLYQMAIDGLLGQLQDPYSEFLKPDDFRSLSEQTTGNYGGLGIQIDVRDGWITVVAPLPDTPAERAGVQTGDQIVEIDGRSTQGYKSDQAVRELRGSPGTDVALTVRRVGVEEPLQFTLTRATIHVRSVQVAMMLDGGVGYVSLSPVASSSAQEVSEAIVRMQGQGLKALIFDLRGNPGGLLDQGVAVSDLFLERGAEIVATRGRAPGANESHFDKQPQRWANLPIVVLVNAGSASAAEIIAGALQDHDRALVVGTPTFGKGLVQSFWRLTPETGLKLTTARWFTPSGRTIQRRFESEDEHDAQVIAAARGQDTTAVDSTETFRTTAGRTVYGGGGIRPDLLVVADTLTAGERAFVRGLGGKIPVYRDVISTYALELKARGGLTDPSFAVGTPMVDEVLRRLAAKDVAIDPEAVAGARTLIAQDLGYEASRYVFGRDAEFRRRMGDDRQIQEALRIARRARTPQELFTLAGGGSTLRN